MGCYDKLRCPVAKRGAPNEFMQGNPITLRANVISDPISVNGPAWIIPMTVPDDIGAMVAFPAYAIRRTPQSTFATDGTMDGHLVPGGYGCFIPFAGDWKILYRGSSSNLNCVIIDAGTVSAAAIFAPGGFATPSHTTASVGVASAQCLAANPFATYRLFENDSAAQIWIMLGAAAVVNQGIRLDPGGSYEMSKENGNLWRGAVRAIASAPASNLLMMEGGQPVPT